MMWTCHICKKLRDDDEISVLVKPLLSSNGIRLGDQNIRYCNDNIKCIEAAKSFSFIKKVEMTEKIEELIKSILCWWEEHQYECISDSDGDEHNVYGEEPDFVTQAKLLKEVS